MSYIPDCRKDRYYNQKYLNEKDKKFLAGFDWAVEMALDNFFDNNYLNGFNDDEFITHELLQELPECEKGKYTIEFDFLDRKEEEREVNTIIDEVRMEILNWAESERDMLITSMIDGMDEDEYNTIKEKVDANENV